MFLPHHLVQRFGADLIRERPVHAAPLWENLSPILPYPPPFVNREACRFALRCYNVEKQEVHRGLQREYREIIALLKREYPAALCSLDYEKDYELLFSTRLSAQCTDERVNMVTPALFAAYPTLESLAAAKAEDIESYIRSCGFYRARRGTL
jgi:hypothetical protein